MLSALRIDRFLHERVDKVLLEQFQRAKKIIGRERMEVEWVAEALLAKGILTADGVGEIVAGQPRLILVERG